MNTYEYFTVTETISETKGKLGTGTDSEADGLELEELSALVQEEVRLPAALLSLGTPTPCLLLGTNWGLTCTLKCSIHCQTPVQDKEGGRN